MQVTLILLLIIAVLVAIVVGLVAYRLGFEKGSASTSAAFNQLLDNNLQRWEYYKTEPTNTDEQQDQNE